MAQVGNTIKEYFSMDRTVVFSNFCNSNICIHTDRTIEGRRELNLTPAGDAKVGICLDHIFPSLV